MSEPWPCQNEPPEAESWLDAELRRVTPPRGLLARLHAIPVGSIPVNATTVGIGSDEALDAILRDVPLPAGLVERLRQIGKGDSGRARRRSRLEERAVAASLVVMSWCSYAAALVLFWLADYPFAHAAASTWLQTTSTSEENRELAPIETMTLVDAPAPDAPSFWPKEGPASRPEETLRSIFATAPGLPDEQLLAFYSPDDLSAALEVPATASRELAGAEVPEEPGFDRSFLSRTGVFPRVDPRRHAVSRAPLTTETASYDLARQALAEGQLPNPDEIRTEEFLAAVEFGLPRPEQRGLALFVAGCRSPWRLSPLAGANESSWLLQIAVAASEVAAAGELGPAEIAAADVRLSVRFNPEAVKSYRLYGHEPTRREGGNLAPTRELLSGQAACVVYELQFASPSEADAALVSLEWRDPEGGAVRRLSRSIRRRDFVAELSDAPAAQRLAALAVAAAEELRRSPFAESIDPAEMLGLARHAAAGENLPGEFQKFVEIFEPLSASQSRRRPQLQLQEPAGAQEPGSP